MIVLQTNNSSRLIEVDKSIFDEAKEFLINISKKRKKTLSYIDDIGDKIVIVDGKEYVAPTKEDLQTIYNLDKDDFIDEDEARRSLDV